MKKILLFTTILAAILFSGCAKKTDKTAVAVLSVFFAHPEKRIAAKIVVNKSIFFMGI